MLTRKPRLFRLQLCLWLYQTRELSNFYYSFLAKNTSVLLANSLEKIDKNGISESTIRSFLAHIPVTLDGANPDWTNTNTIKFALQSSAINVVIETHPEIENDSLFSEKTVNVLFHEKPFIIFNSPFSLMRLRNMGFSTFSPLLNETYDGIVNDNDRLRAIYLEIKRLHKMPNADFSSLLEKLNRIAVTNAVVAHAMPKRIVKALLANSFEQASFGSLG